MESQGIASNSQKLRFDLLGEHVSAEGDAALERYCREISTLTALGIRPGKQRRSESRYAGAQEAQKPKIGSDGLDPVAIFRAVRAEMQKLNDASKILTARGVPNARNILHFRRKRMLDRSRNQRAAIRHEELQQENYGTNENDCGHHRGITARREGTSLASSGKRQKAYAQAKGRNVPKI